MLLFGATLQATRHASGFRKKAACPRECTKLCSKLFQEKSKSKSHCLPFSNKCQVAHAFTFLEDHFQSQHPRTRHDTHDTTHDVDMVHLIRPGLARCRACCKGLREAQAASWLISAWLQLSRALWDLLPGPRDAGFKPTQTQLSLALNLKQIRRKPHS